MDIKTKYSIGHQFFRYDGEKLLELHINKIAAVLYDDGKLYVTYRLGFGENDTYKELKESELDAKLVGNALFKSKEDLVKYLLCLIVGN